MSVALSGSSRDIPVYKTATIDLMLGTTLLSLRILLQRNAKYSSCIMWDFHTVKPVYSTQLQYPQAMILMQQSTKTQVS